MGREEVTEYNIHNMAEAKPGDFEKLRYPVCYEK